MAQIDAPTREIGLPAVIDTTIKGLIVGTFPSSRSLEVQQYYANPRNHFWQIMSVVHGDDYLAVPYTTRLAKLLARRIGLWDVFESCVRKGSLDKSIVDPHIIALSVLASRAPALEVVFFNGGKAAKESARFVAAGYRAETLPSSSSALTLKINEKAAVWRSTIPNFCPPILPSKPAKPLKPFTQVFIRSAIEEGRE